MIAGIRARFFVHKVEADFPSKTGARHRAKRFGFSHGPIGEMPMAMPSFLPRLNLTGIGRTGKRPGYRHGYFSGCSPLEASFHRADETDASHGKHIVPHGRLHDAPFAIGHGPEHGFMNHRLGTKGRGQNLNLLRRSAKVEHELVLGMHPFLRHAHADGMILLAKHDGVGVPTTQSTCDLEIELRDCTRGQYLLTSGLCSIPCRIPKRTRI